MDELLKRLGEIRERAAAIRALDVIGNDEREELTKLVAERKEIEAKVADHNALAELEADDPEVVTPAPAETPAEEKPEETPAAPAETPAETPAEVPAEVPATPAEEEPTPEAIAAAIGGAPSTSELPEASASDNRLPIVASSAGFGVAAGSEMDAGSWARIHNHAKGVGAGVKQVFAQIVRHSDEKALTTRNSAIENSMLMAAAKPGEEGLQSIVAAACYCGPNEVDKSIDTLGLDDRPVAALFRSKPFTGPFDYVRDMPLSAVAGGVTIWECEQQEDVVATTPSTWKPCAVLDCGDAVTVTPYAIPACGLFSIFQQLSHPELVDDFIKKIGIYYARLAEKEILDRLRAFSTTLTYGVAGMGLLNELEGVLGHLAGFTGYVRRINWSNYALILPPGFVTALIADEHRRGFSRGANRESIMQQLRELGVGQVIEALDADSTAEGDYLAAHALYVDPGETVAFNPCTAIGTWTIHIVPVDAFVRGESTLVDAGFERDTSLIRQNMVQYFFEGHEFFEKVAPDVPSFTLELTGAGTGGTSALVTPEAC